MVNMNMDVTNRSTVGDNECFREKYSPLPEPTFTPQNNKVISTITMSDPIHRLKVSWNNLTYMVEGTCSNDTITPEASSGNKKKCSNVILNGLNGSFRSGELTAIMGPSGCGKTTLLECLSGKRHHGVSGDVRFTGCHNVKLSFISQNDHMLAHLTVRESLRFASKLKNFRSKHHDITLNLTSSAYMPDTKEQKENEANGQNKNKKSMANLFNHEQIVQKLLDQFGLNICADVRVSCCSGGQLKRLSIAQELVSQPNLLILDEPTSGLDSNSCYQVIELLQMLTQRKRDEEPLAVVATIHQPSARVFNMFKKVFFLSTTGRCIYEGGPSSLVAHLSSVQLHCPPYTNPADYMLEVASGDYGGEYVDKLALENELMSKGVMATYGDHHEKDDEIRLKLNKVRKNLPFFGHIYLLFQRTFLSIMRDPMLTALRLVSHISVAVFIGLLYGRKIGTASGCPPVYNADNVGAIQKYLYEDIVSTSENVANLFFAIMFVMYGAMLPTVLTFPTELNVFLKERSNGWYNNKTYYLAKTMADIPMQIFFPIIYGSIVYLIGNQLWSPWRFMMFMSILVLTGLVAQAQGLLVSAVFVDDPNAAVYVGPMTSIPFLLFAGFFVRIKTMPSYLVGISYFTYIRYSFEALVALIYGFDRCLEAPLTIPINPEGNSGSALFKFLTIMFSPEYEYDDDGAIINNGTEGSITSNASKGLIDSIMKDFQSNNPFFGNVISDKNITESYVLKQFELTDYSMYVNIGRLVMTFLVFRFVAYLFLVWKADRKR